MEVNVVPYKGKQLDLYNKMIGCLTEKQSDTLYRVKNEQGHSIFFYLDVKGFLHLIMIEKSQTSDKKYQISDYLYSKSGKLQYMGRKSAKTLSSSMYADLLEKSVGQDMSGGNYIG